eukprot:66439-Chlamydomonas_euryale.AAC.1
MEEVFVRGFGHRRIVAHPRCTFPSHGAGARAHHTAGGRPVTAPRGAIVRRLSVPHRWSQRMC